MKSKLILHRPLSLWSYETEYSLGGELKAGQLAALIDGCISRFLPAAVFQAGTIQDLSGCGPQSLLQENAPEPEYPEELLFLSGQYLPPSDDSRQVDEGGPGDGAFQLRLLTKFDQFVGDGHISHELVTAPQGSWPKGLGWREALVVPGLVYNHIRIGLALFHSRRVVWGIVSPVGDQRLFLDADEQNFRLLLRSESPLQRTDLPLADYRLLDRLGVVLNEALHFDLKSDYMRLLQQPNGAASTI